MAVANRPVERSGQSSLFYEITRVYHALTVAGEAQTAAEIAATVGDISTERVAELLAGLKAVGGVTVSGPDYTIVTAS